MSNVPSGLIAGLLIAIGLALVIFAMIVLTGWARRRSKGAVVTGALLSMFAPDPIFEKNIKLAEEARQAKSEEDGEGEGKDPHI